MVACGSAVDRVALRQSSSTTRLVPPPKNKLRCFSAFATPRSRTAIVITSSTDEFDQNPTEPDALESKHFGKFAVAGIVGCALLYFLTSTDIGISIWQSLTTSWLRHSGFIPALSLIFMSEVGDKTFFICAILAMRLGRWISFIGTILALGFMTLFSVGLGVAFRAVPDAMKTTIPIGKYLSIALLLFFGLRNIISGISHLNKKTDNDELADAEEMVQKTEDITTVSDQETPFRSMQWRRRLRYVFVVAALIFVAEWGDRSMLTTIALGASQNPWGVALGGIVGHTLAAIIAVIGGSFISGFISESTVNFVSGILFIVFAITTAFNWT